MKTKTKEKMIDKLVEKDIEMIRTAMSNDDYEYLDNILRGNGWKQYNNLTDEEIEEEYKQIEEEDD
jgi:hypothetical protein